MVKTYIRLLRQKLYIGFFIVISCAFLGAIRGAWKEDREFYIGVTKTDMELMYQSDVNTPDLTGIIGLAAEQNRWSNFDYAFIYAKRGILIYCLLMAVYLPFYQCRLFQALRSFLGKDAKENRLFIHADGENILNTKKSG